MLKTPVSIMKNEVQLNVTIDLEIADTHRTASKLVGVTIETMTDAALRFFYGSEDTEVANLRKRAMAAAQIIKREKKALKTARTTVAPWGTGELALA